MQLRCRSLCDFTAEVGATGVPKFMQFCTRTSGLAYNTVVSLVRAASQRAQQVHNAQVQSVETDEVSADEMWTFVKKS